MARRADHYEVYRGVPIYISADYIARGEREDFDAVKEARDEVDFELDQLENTNDT